MTERPEHDLEGAVDADERDELAEIARRGMVAAVLEADLTKGSPHPALLVALRTELAEPPEGADAPAGTYVAGYSVDCFAKCGSSKDARSLALLLNAIAKQIAAMDFDARPYSLAHVSTVADPAAF